MSLRRTLLSVVLLLQLGLVFIAPNRGTYYGYKLLPIMELPLNALEFGAGWSFFAPDPGPAPLRLEWEVLDARGGIMRSGYFPESGYPYLINERQTRRVALARFFYFSDERQLNVWASWLCRSNPDAHGLRLWKAEATIPNLFKVQVGLESISKLEFGERKSVGNVFCEELRQAPAPIEPAGPAAAEASTT